jgi:hypothetical protein
MGKLLKPGNITFQTPILSVGSLFLKIEWRLPNVVLYEVDIVTHTHTTHIITHIYTLITTLTTIPISAIGGDKWLVCP